MERKSFAVTELKATDEDVPGSFEAVVAVFGNVDRGGDRMIPGAFKRTLEERGLPPVVWSHNWDVPPIGVVKEAVETAEGLHIKGRLFVAEGEDHSIARQVYAAMKAQDGNGVAPLREFSFGYETRGSKSVEEDGEEIRELTDVELFEVGPTLVGMNPDTRLVGAKALREYADQLERTKESAPEEVPAEDKPEPKDDTPLSEEDEARIVALVAAGRTLDTPEEGQT